MASLTYELTLAGLAVGSAAALTGIGLIVTYRATGVLNLAHGAVAMVCAYVMRELVVRWSVPTGVAAALTVLVFAPCLGMLLDRLLSARPRDRVRDLTITIGVFVLLIGVAVAVWGPGARADAPVLFGSEPWPQLGAVLVSALLVAWTTRRTAFGRDLRAVVDNRALAELGGIDTARVAAAGWAFGAATAGLTGILLAPYLRLDPYGLPLLVLEVLAVAVAARLRSLPVAVGVALAIGVAQAQLTRFHPEGWPAPFLQSLAANLFAVALLVAALLPASRSAAARAAPDLGPARGGGLPAPLRTLAWAVLAGLLLLPLRFGGAGLDAALRIPALAVILLSLVLVTGRGGQLSLGQAAYAGLGALLTAHLAGAGVPELVALGLAVLLVAPLGLLTGAPAIRRRGLALALVTLAVGVMVSRFVFAQPYATAGLTPSRPAGFADDRAYYVLELALLAAALLAVRALRRGRPGRAFAALRDHEAGASAAGIPVPRLKLLAFAVGAALAALGGGMLVMAVRAFDPEAFDPIRGLLWFAAVTALGADSTLTAVAAATLLTTLDTTTPTALPALTIGLLTLTTATLLTRSTTPAPPGNHPAPPAFEARGLGRSPSRTPPTPPTPPGTHPAPPALKARGPGQRPSTPPSANSAPPAFEARGPGQRPGNGAAPRTEPPLLQARGLHVRYPGGEPLRGLDLNAHAAHITGIVGENGAGKTTLLHCLAGTLRPSDGRVLLDGRDITRLPPHARARLGLARTFQQPAVFPTLTVEENVRVGEDQGHPHPAHPTHPHPTHPPRPTAQTLRLLDLLPHRHTPAALLPTGILRRTELARALAADPRMLLLDEPTAGLDTAEVAALARVLRALAADGMGLVVIEHDLDLLATLTDTVHTLRDGRLHAP
ncbi:ATP-binding cassette domain-containing protein [Streptomyces sp. NPDC059874]|uniref:ABC transporter permease subunit n=1 Tax=Streptomyces sp. NPDC059874 TaxID=3346983 RepID=UPI00364FBBE2